LDLSMGRIYMARHVLFNKTVYPFKHHLLSW